MSLQSEIIKQNKLFAEFMGGQMMLNSVKFRNCPSIHTNRKLFHYEQLEYHKSWEWIMGVVEKIEELNLPIGDDPDMYPVWVKIEGPECLIRKAWTLRQEEITRIKLTGHGAKFGAVYSACVEFVKWYRILKLQNEKNEQN